MSVVKNHKHLLILSVLAILVGASLSHLPARKKGKAPHYEETEQGRVLTLPDNIAVHLDVEFPGYRLPAETEFDEKMMKYYNSRLIGIHPAVTWGDFNKDKRQDYAFLLITGDTPWGPQVDLVICNGLKRGKFETFRLGEIYGYKDDYLRFRDGKLYKGDYKKGGWYINWIKKNKKYVALKS